MLYAVTAIVFLAIGYIIGAVRTAPEGWQDEETELFHYGHEPEEHLLTAQDHEDPS